MKAVIFALFVALAVAASTPTNSNREPVELIVNGVPEGTPLEVSDIVDVKLHEVKDGEVVAASDLLYPLTAQGLAETAAANDQADNSLPEITLEIPESAALPAPAIPEVVPKPVVLPAAPLPEIVPEPVVLPSPALPEIVPEGIVLPAPALPGIFPEGIVQPAPALPGIVPEGIVLPAPALPEIVPEPIALPAPALPEIVPEPVALPAPPAPEVEVAPTAPTVPQGEIYNDGIVSVTVNTAHAAVSTTVDYLQSLYSVVINYFSNGKEVGHQAL